MSTKSVLSLQYTIVDAFTYKVFGGNPAAVIILDESASAKLASIGGGDRTLQLIAREFNLSETAFITPTTVQDLVPTFGLRWYTPAREVALCGHATLASAHALFNTPGLLPADASLIRFQTLSGILTAKRADQGKIELEFPAGSTTKADDALQNKAKDALKNAIEKDHNVMFVGVGQGFSFKTYMTIELAAPFDLEG